MNYNEKTGIPYGVVQGNNVPDLVDEIMQNGENESWNKAKEVLAEELKDAITRVANDYFGSTGSPAEALDYADLVEHLIDAGLNIEIDEPTYTYEKDYLQGKVSYMLSWLGGAVLIWVLESPWCAYCAPCSPCVPGAGDLDTGREKDEGITAYALPPEECDANWDGAFSFLVTSEN